MTASAIVAISTAVLGLTQFSKWQGVPDKLGPVVVLALSAFGVGIWTWDAYMRCGDPIYPFDLLTGWMAVAMSASGVYGFSRAGGEALTRFTSPPDTGAGSEPTIKT